ncbi:YbaK/EbsC family protein [Nocardioides sp. CFH 31398]|uniref:YbaK/EbsC family protein n=1 Tax=Nocardioides sp. CFH 31398 TaxID=2919579 RepID=UPI001F068E0A|nr:YbaK/EbsC family protein [Nocardioides sp. CFH 31398]MCH1866934.1 YbaK/EbsC family protein [Nocardioides sp. CFH 31398]
MTKTDAVSPTRRFLEEHVPTAVVREMADDTSTVDAAAQALGVEPARIAKTLALRAGDRRLLLVTSGLARLDNAKFKARFEAKPRMLPADETEALTGQPPGGVGPFGHPSPVATYCDVSLRAFDTVFPAAGSRTSAFEIPVERLGELTGAAWVDVCRVPD